MIKKNQVFLIFLTLLILLFFVSCQQQKTENEEKNDSQWLVDVFDMNGQYEDNFFLDFSSSNRVHWIGHSVISDDGTYIFIPEQNQEDGLVSIGKYRIKDVNVKD